MTNRTETTLSKFDRYEVHGCKDDGCGFVEQVPDDEAEFWSLYGHIPEGGLDCIGDFNSRESAEGIMQRITGPVANQGAPVIAVYVRGGLIEGATSLTGEPVKFIVIDYDNLREEGLGEEAIADELKNGELDSVYETSDSVNGVAGLIELIETRSEKYDSTHADRIENKYDHLKAELSETQYGNRKWE